jgi:hypothetical protein
MHLREPHLRDVQLPVNEVMLRHRETDRPADGIDQGADLVGRTSPRAPVAPHA